MKYLSFTKTTNILLLEGEEFRETMQSTMYLVSNFGRVYSIGAGKLLVAGLGGSSPYYNLSLHGKTFTVHSLVLKAFNPGGYFPGAIVDHIDGNHQNNKLDNLQWLTYSQNMLKSIKSITVDYKVRAIKIGNIKQKLTISEVKEVQKVLDKLPPNKLASFSYKAERSELVKALSIKYKVSVSVINRIAARVGRYNDPV